MFYDLGALSVVPPLYSMRCINDEIIYEDLGYIVEQYVDNISMDEVTDLWLEDLENKYDEWKYSCKKRS